MAASQFFMQTVHEYLDPNASVVVDPVKDVPEIWKGYLSDNIEQRLSHIGTELNKLDETLPKAVHAIKSLTKDVFVVAYDDKTYGRRLARIFNKIELVDSDLDSELYPLISRAPVPEKMLGAREKSFLDNAPDPLAWIYETMFDGLESLLGGGLHNLKALENLKELEEIYAEKDWYGQFVAKTEPKMVFEIATNAGGMNILIDLNDKKRAKSSDPFAILADVKDGSLDQGMALWDLLDTMLSVTFSGE